MPEYEVTFMSGAQTRFVVDELTTERANVARTLTGLRWRTGNLVYIEASQIVAIVEVTQGSEAR